eukprot:EG_transcript_50945
MGECCCAQSTSIQHCPPLATGLSPNWLPGAFPEPLRRLLQVARKAGLHFCWRTRGLGLEYVWSQQTSPTCGLLLRMTLSSFCACTALRPIRPRASASCILSPGSCLVAVKGGTLPSLPP